MVVLDPTASSLPFLEGEPLPDLTALSRRHRWAGLGVDVWNGFAATAFLVRGKSSELWVHHFGFRLVEGDWAAEGGGAWSPAGNLLSDRPDTKVLGGPLVELGRSTNAPEAVGGRPDCLILRASREITRIEVEGRSFDVPRHGTAICLFPAGREPIVNAIGNDRSVHRIALDG